MPANGSIGTEGQALATCSFNYVFYSNPLHNNNIDLNYRVHCQKQSRFDCYLLRRCS